MELGIRARLGVSATLLAAAVLVTSLAAPVAGAAEASSKATVVATGFNKPRGLSVGPGGNVYVAEGGKGGTRSTVGECRQAAGAGPYTGGFTGRISVVDSAGKRTTLARRLPSSQTNPGLGSLISGVADVDF